VRIGVSTPSALDFECKPETGFDRFFKRNRLVREHQSGHHAFDQALYVISDDHRVAAGLRHVRGLADDLLALSAAGGAQFKFKRVTCRNGRLWLDFSAIGQPAGVDPLLQACAPALQRVAVALPSAGGSTGRDRLLLRSVLVLAASSGLAISGALHLVRLHMEGAFTVDLSALALSAAFFGSLLLLGLCALAALLLGRSSRFHLVLAELLLVGAFGAFATAYTELRDYNMEFDQSAAEEFSAMVTDKRESRRRRGGRTYYITVNDWNGSDKAVERKVSKRMHDAVQFGTMIKVRQHPGRLGMRWVEGLEDSNGL
jgi:hypothetical protein